ncbi:hypothetical protein M0802_013213, partial [Mischocyttarus mexicanus]
KLRRSCIVTSTKQASRDKNIPSTIEDNKSRSCIVTSTKQASHDKNIPSTIEDVKSRRSCIVTSTKKASNDKNIPSTVRDAKFRRSYLTTSTKKESQDKNLLSTRVDSNLRSYSNISIRKTPQNKNVVSTVVNSSSSELVIKKEKILFFDIPIDSKPRKVTRPIPFSFENRDKLKEQFKLKQSQLNKDNKKTIENLQNNQIKLKQSQLNKDNKKTIENFQNKEDTDKIKLNLSACSSTSKKITNVNIQEKKLLKLDEKSTKQEDKQSDIASVTSEIDLDQKENIKSKEMKIGMNSYERGKQGHEYNKMFKQRVLMHLKQRGQETADQIAEKKLELAMLHKQRKVKAKPMPVYKPLSRIKSTKPLTEPQSPAWAHKNKKETS